MRRLFALVVLFAISGIALSAAAQSATPTATAAGQTALPDWLESVLIFLNTSEGNKIYCYITTLFGATAMYVFSLNRGFQGAIDFLKRFFPNRPESFYARVDFFVVILAGSIIGFILFSPSTTIQALCAGLGWVGAMNTIVNKPS